MSEMNNFERKRRRRKKRTNNNNFFTIMIVPHSKERVVSLKIPNIVPKLAVLLSMGTICIISLLVVLLAHSHQDFADLEGEYQEIIAINMAYDQVINEVLMETELLVHKLDEVDEFKKYIACELGIETPVKNDDNIINDNDNNDINDNDINDDINADDIILINTERQPDNNSLAGDIHDEDNTSLSDESVRILSSRDGNHSLSAVRDNIDLLHNMISIKTHEMEQIFIEGNNLQQEQRVTPDIIPAAGRMVSGFGWRSSSRGGGSQHHNGIDIANAQGTPIIVTADGIVTYVGYRGGYGKLVIVNHVNGYQTYYAHMSSIAAELNDEVAKGDVIGYMGSTGDATGSHLHYEIRINGNPVNPAAYMYQ